MTFPKQVSHQISHVLRLKEGDQVAVLDNSGMIYIVTIEGGIGDADLMGHIVSVDPALSEPQVQLALFFGLTSREKVEWILQKGTEVGVSVFCPFISSRTLVNSPSLSKNKLERWARIIQEAAEQSGRGKLPGLYPPANLIDAIHKAQNNYDLCLLAWEGIRDDGFRLEDLKTNFNGETIALFVGPEGGFSEEEVAAAQEAGCRVVTLGARTLRTETAAIVFPALVLHELGAL